MKQKSPNSNWLSHHDIFNLLEIEGFEMISHYRKLLIPKYIPLLNFLINRFLGQLAPGQYFGTCKFCDCPSVANQKRRIHGFHYYSGPE